jgi:tetratricopeptide (TPR) repeat protein
MILTDTVFAIPDKKGSPVEENARQALNDTNKIIVQAHNDCEKGEWETAITLLSAALAKDPENVRLKKEIGSIYLSQASSLLKKDPHSAPAVQLAKQALYLDPSNSEAQRIIVATWGVLNPPEFAFSVKMPNLAEHQSANNLQGKADNWTVRYGGSIYQVGACRFNDLTRMSAASSTTSGRQSILDGMVQGYFAGIGTKSGSKVESLKLISEKPFSSCMAKHYTFSVRNKDGRTVLDGKSVFCINESFSYMFSVISPQSNYDLTDCFLSSVRIDSTTKK